MNHGATVRIVVVGDGAVGKTCLCDTYIDGKFTRDKYRPTIFNEYQTEVTVKNKAVKLIIYDTAGQDDYKHLRTISYSGAHVFLVCFSVDSRTSFKNIPTWVEDIRKEVQHVACVLVATKKDLKSTCDNPVTTAEGKKLASDLKLKTYVECSALTNEGVREAINEAILCSTPFQPDKAKPCVIS